jgi:hypothetical protein
MELFKFFVEADVDVVKSDSGESRRIIRGYASTPANDRQGESLVQKGLDISEFVNNGWLNYDHDNSIILGYPTAETHIDDHGLWVEGELLKGVPMADKLWDLAVALKKSNAPRKLGFSVEGKVLERKGNSILKAKIYNCALTPNPVNTEATWDAVVKSFRPDADIDVSKGLEAGYAVTPETQTNGGALRSESLDSDLKRLAENLDDHSYWGKVRNNLADGGKIGKNEMVVYLQLSKGLSRQQADDILKQY